MVDSGYGFGKEDGLVGYNFRPTTRSRGFDGVRSIILAQTDHIFARTRDGRKQLHALCGHNGRCHRRVIVEIGNNFTRTGKHSALFFNKGQHVGSLPGQFNNKIL